MEYKYYSNIYDFIDYGIDCMFICTGILCFLICFCTLHISGKIDEKIKK